MSNTNISQCSPPCRQLVTNMLPVVISICLSGFASATYYLNQPPTPSFLSNRIDRPVGYGVGYGGGVYPNANPLLQNLFASASGGFPPVVQRLPVSFTNPKPVAGRPVAQLSPSPAVSELLALLTSQAQLNNLVASQDLYEGYEEKGQADPDKPSRFRNNIIYPTERLRTALPILIYRSSLRNNEENVTTVKDEEDLKKVIAYATGGNEMVFGLNPAVEPAMNQVAGDTVPASPAIPFITVKVVPQATAGMSQTHIKQTAADTSNELNNALEAYTLQLSGTKEKAPEFQLVTTGAIDAFPEGGEVLTGGDVQSGAVPSNTAAVLGLRKNPLQPYGDLLIIPNGGRLSKSIGHSRTEDETTETSQESEAVER